MFERLRQVWARCAELRELGDSLTPAELAKPDDMTSGRPLQCLPVPGKPDAFMRLGTGQADHDRFLVPVNVKAFNRPWLAGGLSSLKRPDGCLLCRDMTGDSKYRHAIDGFAAGRDSPVSLANVVFRRGHAPSVRFSDGVTCTLWLLADNVAAFPVLVVGGGNAKALAKLAGTDGSIMRVSEVMCGSEKAPQSRRGPLGTKRGGVGREWAKNTSEKVSRGQGRPSHGRGIGVDD